MLCDVHTHIGHWPFRKLPFTDANGLLKEMDRLGIEKAAVCNTNSVFYKNPQSGNEELFRIMKRHIKKNRNRFFPVATLNPLYINAEEDLKRCREDFGFGILRLVPTYHNYELNDEKAVEFARRAVEMDMSVLIPRLMVDVRQKHLLDVEKTVEFSEIIEFAKTLEQGRVIGVEFPVQKDAQSIQKLLKTKNVFFGISRIPYLNRRILPDLIEKVGSDRFLFASGMPFKVPETGILKLCNIKNKRDQEQIGRKNFLRLTMSQS